MVRAFGRVQEMGETTRKTSAKRNASKLRGGLYKRGSVYYARFRANGQLVHESLQTENRAVAEDRLHQLKRDHSKAKFRETTDIALPDAVEPYMREHVNHLKPKTQKMYEHGIANCLAQLKQVKLTDIDANRLLEMENGLRDRGLSGGTIINIMRVLSSWLEYSVVKGWIQVNPVPAFLKMRKRSLRRGAPKTRYLSHEEEARLLKCAKWYDEEWKVGRPPARMYPRILFAIESGLRVEEQRELKWSDVDLEQGHLIVRADVAKSHKERRVPLTPRMLDVLGDCRVNENVSEYVFPSPLSAGRVDNWNKAWRRVRADAELHDVDWHDLRRTCGCRLLQDLQYTIHEVQYWMGHASVTQTESTYAFLDVDKLKRGWLPRDPTDTRKEVQLNREQREREKWEGR